MHVVVKVQHKGIKHVIVLQVRQFVFPLKFLIILCLDYVRIHADICESVVSPTLSVQFAPCCKL